MSTRFRGLILSFVLAVLVMALAGCSPSKPGYTAPVTPKSQNMMPASTSGATKTMAAKPDPNSQMCAQCSTGAKTGAYLGVVDAKGSVQVVNVAIKDGTYTPNRFTAKAGVPIDVLFTVVGEPAKGCLSKPTFKSLKKSLDITSGSKTLSLGPLAAGSYEFTCSMGMNMGRITVQ